MSAPAVAVLGRAQFGLRGPSWDLAGGHTLIAGTTGAGKSSWVNSAVGALAPLPHVQLIGLDLKRVELSPWSGRLAALAREPIEADQLARQLDRLLDARAAIADAHRWKWWRASADLPYVALIADELAEAAAHAAVLDVVLRIGRVGRALGVVMLAATQQPNAKVLGGTDLRSLFVRRAALFDPEQLSYVMALGQQATKTHASLLAWLSMDRPGLAVWSDPSTHPVPWLARAHYWTDGDVDHQVAATGHLAVPLDRLICPEVPA